MFVLDTDLFSLLDRPESKVAVILNLRIRALGFADVVTSIITFEEQTRGWLSWVARAKAPEAQVKAYQMLSKHLETYRTIIVLPFDQKASWEFQRLQVQRLRVSTMDL